MPLPRARSAWSAAAGLAALACAGLSVWAFGLLQPEHSWLHQYVSVLGADGAPYRHAFRVVTVLSGGGLVLSVLWVRRVPGIAATAVLAATAGALLAAGAFVNCDPECAHATVEGRVHKAIGMAAIASGVLAAIVCSAETRFAAPTTLPRAAWATFLSGATVAVLWADKEGAWRGLTQRILLVGLLAWWAWLSWSLHRTQSDPEAGRLALHSSA